MWVMMVGLGLALIGNSRPGKGYAPKLNTYIYLRESWMEVYKYIQCRFYTKATKQVCLEANSLCTNSMWRDLFLFSYLFWTNFSNLTEKNVLKFVTRFDWDIWLMFMSFLSCQFMWDLPIKFWIKWPIFINLLTLFVETK